MQKDILLLSFKKTFLLLCFFVIASLSVNALPQLKWNFTNSLEGYTQLYTDGGSYTFTQERFQITGGTYHQGYYYNMSQAGVQLNEVFPLNLSMWIKIQGNYFGLGLTNISSGRTNYGKGQAYFLFQTAATGIVSNSEYADGINCDGAFGNAETRVDFILYNETRYEVFSAGSSFCRGNFTIPMINDHTDGIFFFMKNDASGNNAIDNITIEYYESVCLSNYTNSTWSEWEHQTECSTITNLQQHNRSLISVDQNECNPDIVYYEYQNLTCYTCDNVYNKMEDDNMFLVLGLLYVTFMLLGYYALRSGNATLGLSFLGITIPMDFLIVKEFYDQYVSGSIVDSGWGSGFLFIFGIGLLLWIVLKVSSLFLVRYKA